ncbi:NACHT domain-containing protein [Sphaerisporangium dianthi]|uniref:NACHT domain-containing protein n=1 Tax=Sphaerisporangium dianthi TaxID=1436120 RepID=A0ABV9CQI8_9ACTN
MTNLASSLLDSLGLSGWVVWPAWFLLLAAGLIILGLTGTPATGYTGDHAQGRAALLERMRRSWIDGVLDHSLYQEARVELGLKVSADLPHPWRTTASRSGRDHGPWSAGAVPKVYDELGKVMLILGAPGAGKSTLLLELLRELLGRAAADDREPIPVVLQLPGWAVTREPFAAWVAREIGSRYDIPLRYAEAWVADDRLAVLLDGLDEVAAEHRDECVREINGFRREHGFTPLVVCCRTSDHQKLNATLELYGTLTILPLERAAVEDFLVRAGVGLAGMRAALDVDPGLWRMLDSPLLLSVMALAYRDGAPATDTGPLSDEQRLATLFSAYTVTMLRHRSSPRFSVHQTVTWLAYLANRMRADAQVLFTPDRVDHLWGAGGDIRFMKAQILGFAGSLALVIPAFVVSGWPGALAAAFLGALFGRERRDTFAPLPLDLLSLSVEQDMARRPDGRGGSVRSAWRYAFMELRHDFGWYIGIERHLPVSFYGRGGRRWRPHLVAFGLGAAVGPLFGLGQGGVAMAGYAAATAVVTAVAAAAVRQFAGPVRRAEPQARWSEVPSPMVWSVLAAGSRAALALGAACGAFAGLVVTTTAGVDHGLAFAGLVVFAVTLYGVGLLGGWAALQQARVRRVLRREGLFPLPSRPFLDHAVQCLFLRSVGEGYIFVHRSLMEFFASLTDGLGRIDPAHLDAIATRAAGHKA